MRSQQPTIYTATVINRFGEYTTGSTVEVSRAPSGWRHVGERAGGWIVTAAGCKAQHLSEACAKECLRSVRGEAGRPVRVTSVGAKIRRSGYIRATELRRARAAMVANLDKTPAPTPEAATPVANPVRDTMPRTAPTEAEVVAAARRMGLEGSERDAYVYMTLNPNSQIRRVLAATA